jgi:mannose-6-phosphate isomerase
LEQIEEKLMPYPLQLAPEYRDYVWGGTRLRPGNQRTAEAWVVFEQNKIINGPLAGKTLIEAVEELGPDLLGRTVYQRTGSRFPLLIKLLDCADWLSLQVHPNDEQARRLEGPDQFGKTEAWHILEADPGASLLFGLRPGTDQEQLQAAVTGGTILDLVQSHQVQQGDTVFIRPGMIHALGPGLLIYEVQQTSNITYRVFDWNRPAAAGRKLHIAESLEVLDPQAEARIVPRPDLPDGGQAVLAKASSSPGTALCSERSNKFKPAGRQLPHPDRCHRAGPG